MPFVDPRRNSISNLLQSTLAGSSNSFQEYHVLLCMASPGVTCVGTLVLLRLLLLLLLLATEQFLTTPASEHLNIHTHSALGWAFV